MTTREGLECKRRIYELNNVHPDQYDRIPGLLKEDVAPAMSMVFQLLSEIMCG